MERTNEIVSELDRVRRANGLTYYAIAKNTGQSQIGVQRVLSGIERPGLDRILAIAAALGKTLVVSPLAANGKRSEKTGKIRTTRLDNSRG